MRDTTHSQNTREHPPCIVLFDWVINPSKEYCAKDGEANSFEEGRRGERSVGNKEDAENPGKTSAPMMIRFAHFWAQHGQLIITYPPPTSPS
jgi:hypothetical protein